MWPSVPAFRNFGNIACPSGTNCELPYCIFSHDTAKTQTGNAAPATTSLASDKEPDAKRLKLENGPREPPLQTKQAQSHPTPNSVFVGSIVPKIAEVREKNNLNATPPTAPQTKPTDGTLPRTATRPVSPPPKAEEKKVTPQPEVHVPLMPRKIIKEPAAFTKRLTFLKALHAYMKPLNDKIKKAVKPEIKALHLSENLLNKLAVDEEEKLATENPAVYDNVLKQRLVKLKSMTPEEWVKGRREALAKERGVPLKRPTPQRVNTGLTPKEEVAFLSTLISPQAGLDAHGYVTKIHTEAQIEEARAIQQSSGSWEQCDRCSTRFQVFSERREEDGALTTGGQCRHHWGKRVFPKRGKNSGLEPTRLSCCNEPVGAPGCTTHDTHVYKMIDSKQLALVMPFIETPENDKVKPGTAVCFDCEMGYTTNGLELLRLTAVSWPSHKPILDVLVRPLGYLLDVNTRFSGVTAEEFVNAKPYDPQNPTHDPKDLHIVESPYTARDLFVSLISPKTPVLGHALENDLNSIRLVHPTIVDTILLYPHRQGLPMRHGLKFLVKNHLGLDIQQAGAAGHDSLEDARATGELIRLKVSEKWKVLKDDGWSIRDGIVCPPLPRGGQPPQMSAPQAPSMVPAPTNAVLQGKAAEKRKFDQVDEQESDIQPTKIPKHE